MQLYKLQILFWRYLWLLILGLCLSVGLKAATPYAVLNDDNTVLTFYYDDQKENRGGMSVGPFSFNDIAWRTQQGTITTVVFDASFANCTSLTSTAYWFSWCTKLTTITGIENLKTDNVTDMSCMFNECVGLTSLDVSGFKTDNVMDMRYMFSVCQSLTSLDVSGFKTDKVTDMSCMFQNCSSLMSLDVSGFKTDNVTTMERMFINCYSLTSLDVSGFKTDNVTNMSYMFCDCCILRALDLSNFNTEKVTNMSSMFQGCFYLKTIYVSDGWDATKVTNGTQMFSGCSQLIGGNGTSYNYNSDHEDHTYARIDGGKSTPGYLTSIPILQIQDATREYGEANPIFSYVVKNGSVSGMPGLTTTATITSPVGTYPITAERGTYLVNNGALTITKAPLTVSVKDCRRYKAEANPTFELDYSGFKNGETEAVLTQKPTVTCAATADSPTGIYTLTVSGGEATNYDFIYSDGTLTIKDYSFTFVLDNITYGVLNEDITSVAVVSVPECEHVEIPASIKYSDKTYTVTTLAGRAFYGLRQLKSVQIQASITTVGNEVFGNCPNLSAIVWLPSMTIPATLLAEITNPNLLLYANASRWTDHVPSVISNKIHDGIAKSITLTDSYPFYCPLDFTAEEISYTHEYKQETIIGQCAGWETIALPFTVQTITHEDETKGKMAPFAANDASARPFWLYSLQTSGEKFAPASSIQANTPYILSMPNNPEYTMRYNLAGKVTFSAKNAKVEASTALHPVQRNAIGYSVMFIPSYSILAQTDDILALNRDGVWQDNPQGSIFRSHRVVQPFEAYILWQGGVGVKEFRIADDDATDIREVEMKKIRNVENETIYDLGGRLVSGGHRQTEYLRPGVYIHQGRKVLVK